MTVTRAVTVTSGHRDRERQMMGQARFRGTVREGRVGRDADFRLMNGRVPLTTEEESCQR